MNRENARKLRKALTETEMFVWRKLRDRRFVNFKFRRQVPLGGYVVDFLCFQKRLILELDGGQHGEQKEYDQRRDGWLREQGFQVLRFWNHEVLQDWEVMEEVIWKALQ